MRSKQKLNWFDLSLLRFEIELLTNALNIWNININVLLTTYALSIKRILKFIFVLVGLKTIMLKCLNFKILTEKISLEI